MKPSKIIAKTSQKKSKLAGKRRRTQTAEGWRRTVKKMCEKRDPNQG